MSGVANIKSSGQVLVNVVMGESKFAKLFPFSGDSPWRFQHCTPEQAISCEEDGIIIIDASFEFVALDRFLKTNKQQKIVIFERDEMARMIDLMNQHPGLNHFLCVSGQRYQERLNAILLQMACPPGPALTHYPAIEEATRITVSNSLQKTEVLTRLSRFAVRLAGFSQFAETVETIAWELMSNAIFNAPIDRSSGKKKYMTLPRNKKLELSKDEYVQIEFGVMDDFLVFYVKDQFGLLERETIVSNLLRCKNKGQDQMRTAPGGAGMGMYMVLNMATQLDFFVKKNKSTEVVCLINFSKRQRDYEQFGVALNMTFED